MASYPCLAHSINLIAQSGAFNLSPDDFDIMRHYCSIFKPFKEITVELSSEKGISISKVIILCNVLLPHIKKKKEEANLPSAIYSMLITMENKAEKKFEGIEEQPVLTEATILDPRFKKRGFIKKNNVSEDEVKDIQKNTKKNEQFDIWKDFDLQTPATTTTTPRT
ncbi:hypothetical protein QTP88_023798 [Uroleucon formosanum]